MPQSSHGERFWSWFIANEARIRRSQPGNREGLLDEILVQLHAYCDELFFETGCADDEVHELVISAEQKTELFDVVVSLVDDAPTIDGWRIIALKPARGFGSTTRHGSAVVAPATSWFLPLEAEHDRTRLGIRVACLNDDVCTAEDLDFAVRIMLANALGERAFAMEIHHLEVVAMPENPEAAGYIELVELGNYLDWRRGRSSA